MAICADRRRTTRRSVFKHSVKLANMKQWGDFNRVYLEHFNDLNFPTRSALGANGLALVACTEVEAEAEGLGC